ncbi:MAG: hypothetical protein Q8M21_08485 [Methylococcaceae bacterium]|jgi:hypothetical protein|nr:hypothetical protein [Methylococcaceae bacterium]
MVDQINSNIPTKDQLDKWASVYRSMMVHENELQNHRMTWLLAIQGFLMTGLAFAWDKQDARMLIFVFCGLGILISLTFWEGLRISKKAQYDLRNKWDGERDKMPSYSGPDIVGYRSPQGSLLKYLRPWRFLPFIFIIAWGLIAILNYPRL